MTDENKYEDIFQDPDVDQKKWCKFSFLGVLIGIKLLITNRYEEGTKAFDEFSDILSTAPATSTARKIANSGPVMDQIRRCLTGLGDTGYEIQKTHLEKYLKIAAERKKSILPALIDPQPPTPRKINFIDELKTFFEPAWLFLKLCPGAKDKIAKFLGPNATFDF